MHAEYVRTVQLLPAAAPAVFDTAAFAMKGGAALHLFLQDMPGFPWTSTSSSSRIELSRDATPGAIDTELAAVQAPVDALGRKAIPFRVQEGYFASRFAAMCA